MLALHFAAAAGLTTAVLVVLKARRAVVGTTLVVPWGCLLAALGVWTIVWLVTAAGLLTVGVADRLWYVVAVLMLCPGIAVLGARRPGAHAWTWFVLAPLVLVLTVPVIAAGSTHLDRRLELEAPAAVGFFLVLLMGTGNYFGTRFAGAATMFAFAPMLLLTPSLSPFPDPPENVTAFRSVMGVWLGLTSLKTWFVASRRRRHDEPLEPLWSDFRDRYGTVWAKRVADRVTEALTAQQLPSRFDPYGLTWTMPDPPEALRQRSLETAEKNLRWLLKRFVAPEWVEQRLKAVSVQESKQPRA